MIFIRICINTENKTIQFWLTTEERESNGIIDVIKSYTDNYTQDRKYKKVIFVSGTSPLATATADLLKRNR